MDQQDSIPDPGDRHERSATGDAATATRAELLAARAEVDTLRAALSDAAERERALAHELQHRVRNMLSVIRSVYRRTRASGASEDELADHFEGRLDALSRYQAQVDGVGRAGIDLEDMLRNELLGSHRLDQPGCTLSGPPVRLDRKSAELIGLAIHELATNSIKFGALAQDGQLSVEWSVTAARDGAVLRMHWAETGVTIAGSAPRPSGFGRQLIEEALPYQLGATTSFALRPGGVDCVIALPLPAAAPQEEMAP